MGIAADPAGAAVYVVDASGYVRQFDTASLQWTSLPGLTIAQAAGVAVDATAALYVSDASAHTIWSKPAGGNWSIVGGAGTGAAGYLDGGNDTSLFSVPASLSWAATAGQLIVADTGNSHVRFGLPPPPPPVPPVVNATAVNTTSTAANSTAFEEAVASMKAEIEAQMAIAEQQRTAATVMAAAAVVTSTAVSVATSVAVSTSVSALVTQVGALRNASACLLDDYSFGEMLHCIFCC